MRHKSVKWLAAGLAGLLPLVSGGAVARANFTLTPDRGAAQPGQPSSDKHQWRSLAFPVAQGFGANIPLAFALRQLVPAGVLVIAPASLNTHHIIVSWRGGVPWNVALQAALRAAGLTATITPVSVAIKIATTP